MLMKNSNDTIGNRSRDRPVCGAVAQPLRHRVLPGFIYKLTILNISNVSKYHIPVVIFRYIFSVSFPGN
jgi:hypothetical protein